MATKKKSTTKKSAGKSSPKSLPRLQKTEIDARKFAEKPSEASGEPKRVVWIILCAFVVLVVFGGIVWFVFSGRPNQRIHGENLDKFTESSSEPLAPSR
ncbi:hypothetical protein IJI72_00355 [Candidatus Saccharibacteria bacterium]|nr:hypothetical protein [Candidatus Saccharibacteria bacterium]